MKSKVKNVSNAKTASEKIAAVIKRDILDGKFMAREKLPTERVLAETHGVSRPVVREALKHLQAQGLIKILKSSGSYVNDFDLMGGIELLEDMLSKKDGHLDLDLVEDIWDFYFHLMKGALRLAARRRTEEELDEIRHLINRRLKEFNDIEILIALNTEIFMKLALASQNRVYRLAFNSLSSILAKIRKQVPLTEINPVKQKPYLEMILEGMERKDPDLVGLYFDRMADGMKTTFVHFLDTLRENSGKLTTKR